MIQSTSHSWYIQFFDYGVPVLVVEVIGTLISYCCLLGKSCSIDEETRPGPLETVFWSLTHHWQLALLTTRLTRTTIMAKIWTLAPCLSVLLVSLLLLVEQ
ncbi:uncharacterized protein LOC110990785 [Acanthaster planci]|uniref:Uncharacterized protein LOC110990785 n=1 Tax=Acanthaster planci TaxID=133434 RepID=A0A8B8A6G6_ACAPL|nr:uncharacterized protein LOC110990785 [Acanthaster planci]